MKLVDLIARFRQNTDDTVVPYNSSDDEIVAWLNEAEQEACVRAKLLHEADDPAICEIAVSASGSRRYELDPSVIEIEQAYFVDEGGTRTNLDRQSRQEVSRRNADWRELTETPTAIIHYDDHRIELDRIPVDAGTIHIECYRLPSTPLDVTKEGAEPEIGRAHHIRLLDWAEHCCFARRDSLIFDAGRSNDAEAKFTRYFGPRPDAAQRKDSQADQPHTNKVFWP